MKQLMLGGMIALAAVASALPAPAQARKAGDDRPVLAVVEFKNDTAAGWWGGGVGRELSGMLSNELSATGDFRMVDRHKLDSVLQEQDLAASGRVRKGTGARIGNLTGAQYLVSGTVTAFEQNTSSTGGGFSFKGIHLGGKHQEAYIAIDIQVVDAETGEIAYTRTVEGRSSGGGVSVGLYRGGFGGELGHENNTPTGKAIRAALVEASDYLDCAMVIRDSCLQEFRGKERRRRNSDRGAIKLD
ncbi:MAG TPA: CsgG/HfaB family protein [Rhodanobacteraceae bacterium]|nr:CsgG/HfaB family protein [Rhodanobacteraceae bacterium]